MQESRKDTSITDSSAGSRASSEGVSGVDEGVIKTAQARVETVSYAQNCEDIMLLRALGAVDSSTGFYVDVGAQDPVVDSVTKAFYERGWHGINIDPVQHWYQRLVADRPRDINLNVAASSSNGHVHFYEVEDTGLSTVKEELAHDAVSRGYTVRGEEVVTRRLDSILTMFDPEQIHFLKIDVEGAERDVLVGIDFTVTRPWIVLVEAMTPADHPSGMVPSHEEWEYLLTETGYEYVYFDGLNRFYVAEEHGSCANAFQFPPSYWRDWFIPYREYLLREELVQEQMNGKRLREAEDRILAVEKDLTHKLQRARDQVFNLEQELKSRSAELSAIYSSTSWRITKPIRSSSPGIVKLRKAYKGSMVYRRFLSHSSAVHGAGSESADHDMTCCPEEALRLYKVLKSSIEDSKRSVHARASGRSQELP
ncbi:MAG: FkbM family methyltransferase [Actinobacteria bacterium]|nr:FkbM family methyltransferase [Actinomycetota bacterium]MCL5447563.1 FkbM family methyltransferase [Actinomycetota bacterium]